MLHTDSITFAYFEGSKLSDKFAVDRSFRLVTLTLRPRPLFGEKSSRDDNGVGTSARKLNNLFEAPTPMSREEDDYWHFLSNSYLRNLALMQFA